LSEEPKTDAARRPNRLVGERSPYLLQHAYNPVDWYPWCEEALAHARAEKRPILLSIGYSACHWCHVMERESFEDETLARLINDNFVAIKVDREERPDLDHVYLEAVQLMTGRGGWPLTVFLTPEGAPFFGGTYFPRHARYGMPGFDEVLTGVARFYREQSEEVRSNVEKLGAALERVVAPPFRPGEPAPELAWQAARALAAQCDRAYGGLKGAPKFPQPFVFSLMLRAGMATGDEALKAPVALTLRRMAEGGIADQLGGGFHRYSVDEQWLVPHFEKMIYDNALLAQLYLDAGRALEKTAFLETARSTLDYVRREMTSPEGAFYSSQDADSAGGEGTFYVWRAAEARQVLGEELFPLAARYYDITEEGNFEGANVLHRTLTSREAAALLGIREEDCVQALDEARRRLFEARQRRVKPERDDKVLAAWNGLMISAFAQGYCALGAADYLEAACRAADFAAAKLWDGNRLARCFKGGAASPAGFLEDYALMASAMLDVYEASLSRRYLELAEVLGRALLERFFDAEQGGFFFTSEQHERLIARPKPLFDGSTPSGNSAAVMAMLRLHAYTGERAYLEAAEGTLKLFIGAMAEQPFGFAHMFEALDFYQRGPVEIVIAAGSETAETGAWLNAIRGAYLPNRALFVVGPSRPVPAHLPEALAGQIPARAEGVTGFVCRARTCSAPIRSSEELAGLLRTQ
jgi:uncharacterized protein YyaL (SSP411 family)